MTALTQRLKERFFGQEHPYRTFEEEVARHLREQHTLLDAGCGRTAPVLEKFKGKAHRLIGIDVVDFDPQVCGMELLKQDLTDISVPSGSVDVVMSRSVMEHVVDPKKVYAEIHRILKPG